MSWVPNIRLNWPNVNNVLVPLDPEPVDYSDKSPEIRAATIAEYFISALSGRRNSDNHKTEAGSS